METLEMESRIVKLEQQVQELRLAHGKPCSFVTVDRMPTNYRAKGAIGEVGESKPKEEHGTYAVELKPNSPDSKIAYLEGKCHESLSKYQVASKALEEIVVLYEDAREVKDGTAQKIIEGLAKDMMIVAFRAMNDVNMIPVYDLTHEKPDCAPCDAHVERKYEMLKQRADILKEQLDIAKAGLRLCAEERQDEGLTFAESTAKRTLVGIHNAGIVKGVLKPDSW